MSKLFLFFCLSIFLAKCETMSNLQVLHEFIDKYIPFSQHNINEKKMFYTKELKEVCDENQILLQLARLYAISPERIILLLLNKSISETCQDVSNALQHINGTMADCIPLKPDNLYKKLYEALEYFNSYVCLYNSNEKDNHLIKYLPCLKEIREDLLDCEGPPDWFEKSDEAAVCPYYNDIINCNYVKAAMLCGLKPALLLRTFSDEIMKIIVKFRCKISRSLPHVDDPMPARACLMKYHINLVLYTCFFLEMYAHSYVYTLLFMYLKIFNIDPVSQFIINIVFH